MQQYAKIFIALGLILILLGIIVYFFGDTFKSFGNLPGDIKINKPNFKIFFPITTMLILSIVLNLIIWLIKKVL